MQSGEDLLLHHLLIGMGQVVCHHCETLLEAAYLLQVLQAACLLHLIFLGVGVKADPTRGLDHPLVPVHATSLMLGSSKLVYTLRNSGLVFVFNAAVSTNLHHHISPTFEIFQLNQTKYYRRHCLLLFHTDLTLSQQVQSLYITALLLLRLQLLLSFKVLFIFPSRYLFAIVGHGDPSF